MAGVTPNEAETLCLNLIYGNADADRGTNLQLGLFTNSVLSEASVLGDITEPTGGGYARINLVDGSWVVTGDNATYPQQVFTVTTTDYVGDVYGYFIATTGTTPRLLHYEVDPSGPYDMNVDDTYTIDLSTTVA